MMRLAIVAGQSPLTPGDHHEAMWLGGTLSMAEPRWFTYPVEPADSDGPVDRHSPVAATMADLAQRLAPLSEVDAIYVPPSVPVMVRSIVSMATLQKPLLIDIGHFRTRADWEAIASACRGASVEWSVGNLQRYRPYDAHLRRVVQQGILGAPGLLRVHHWRPAMRDGDRVQVLHALLLQAIDVACDIFSAVPEIVFGFQEPLLSQLHLGFAAGGMCLIDYSDGLPEATPPYSAVSLIGASGAYYADDHHNTHLKLSRGWQAVRYEARDGAIFAQIADWLEQQTPERWGCASQQRALAALQVHAAWQAAVQTGTAVRLLEPMRW